MDYAQKLFRDRRSDDYLEGNLWIKEIKDGLVQYYKDNNINSNLLSLENVTVGIESRSFKLNFLWQQRRFWERIQTYNKWFGSPTVPRNGTDWAWSSPDEDGPFIPNPKRTDSRQHKGYIEKVYDKMTDAVMKRIQAYGGPSAGFSTLRNIQAFGGRQPFNLDNGNLILERFF